MSEWGHRLRTVQGEVQDVVFSPTGKPKQLLLRLKGTNLEIAESLAAGVEGAKPFRERVRGEALVVFSGDLSKWLHPREYRPAEEGLVSALCGQTLEVRFRVMPYSFRSQRPGEEGRKIEGIAFKLSQVEIKR